MAGSIYDWSTTAASNGTADASINFAEGQAPSTVNDSARQMMGREAELLKDLGGGIAAGGTANALTLTAASAFTTLADGRIVAFRAIADNAAGVTTINVNAIGVKSIRKMVGSGETDLAAGDIKNGGIFVLRYGTAFNGAAGAWMLQNPVIDISTLAALSGAAFTGAISISNVAPGTLLTVTSTDPGAGSGPDADFYRNSASPAAFDLGFTLHASFNNSTPAKITFGNIQHVAQAVTAGAETGAWDFQTIQSGSLASRMVVRGGMYMTGATGTDKGVGTINATGYYLNGTAIPTTSATAAQYRANSPTGLILLNDQVWLAAAEVTLTDAATIAVDMSTFINAAVTLGANRTLGTPSNPKVGQTGVIRIIQDATGSRTLSYAANWKFAGGTAPTLSTAANAVDYLFYYVATSTSIFGNVIKAVA